VNKLVEDFLGSEGGERDVIVRCTEGVILTCFAGNGYQESFGTLRFLSKRELSERFLQNLEISIHMLAKNDVEASHYLEQAAAFGMEHDIFKSAKGVRGGK
jgi:hypothetical protein